MILVEPDCCVELSKRVVEHARLVFMSILALWLQMETVVDKLLFAVEQILSGLSELLDDFVVHAHGSIL